MTAGLKPYPAKKGSGVPWLGRVPGHWEVRRLKTLCSRSAEYGANIPASSYSSYGVRFIRTTDIGDDGELKRSGVYVDRDSVREYILADGDLLVSRSGTVGRSFLYDAQRHGPCAYAGYLVRFVPTGQVLPDFVRLFTKTTAFADYVQLVAIASTIENVNAEKYANLAISLPPLPEQTSIVRFLDHADRRIKRYIRAKQKLIRLLEEQKQVIVHRAVTRGLDLNVRLRSSGVVWLGDVPEHWEVLALKRWVSAKITDGPHETPEWLDDGVAFLSAEAMVSGRLDFRRRRGYISRELHEAYCRKCRPQRDDIFMCKSGATTGKVAIVETDDEFSVWSPLALIRVDPERVLPHLLLAVLQCRYVQRQVQDTWSYGTQPNLSMAAMERLMVALPPIDEQVPLLAHIDAATRVPNAAIERSQREVALLREYRTRLIADVVTGKLDVREAAARLPDELAEPERIDEQADDSADAEEPDTEPEEVEA
jgi:type I restriction enzyme S subunit